MPFNSIKGRRMGFAIPGFESPCPASNGIVKESSLQKREMFPDIDHVDIPPRPEALNSVPGRPVLLQVPVVPSYALTVHKTQALSIKHKVRGCLEGVSPLAGKPNGVPSLNAS